MSKTTTAPSRPSTATKKPSEASANASQQADKQARKGEPLTAEKPKERSPKQENL